MVPDKLTEDQFAVLAKEQEIVDLMIGIHCKGMKHERISGNLCVSCESLREYSVERNEECPFLQTGTKTFCQFCEAHCYSLEQRQAIIEVMRYAGPRMFWHRPAYAIKHLMEVLKHKR